MRRGRRARWLGVALVVAVVALGIPVAALALTAQTSSAPLFAAVNGSVGATVLHEVVGTTAFPNFSNGAVDNRYPLANSHVDSSPSSEGVASPADTGPIGQTIATLPASPPKGVPLPPSKPINQPQYADLKYPPGATAPLVFGVPGGLYAAATATLNDATAQAHLASTTAAGIGLPAGVGGSSGLGESSGLGGASVSSARASLLRVALATWRARWLSAEGVQRFPMPHLSTAAASPDGVAVDTAGSHANFDPIKGLLTLSSEAHAGVASFGGGLLQIRGVHVKLTLTNDGTTPKDAVVIEVAGAQVAGVPVVIDQNGVMIANTAIPTVIGAIQAADDALNQALGAAGIKVFTLSPTISKQGNQETVDATGIHVQFVQPPTPPLPIPVIGGAQQNFDHIIGEAFASSLATPGQPPSSGSTGLGEEGLGGSAGSAGTFIPGTLGTPGTPGSPAVALGSPSGPRTATLSPLRRISHTKPTYLLLLYFLWQTTLLGAAASLWWWRMAGASP